MPYFDPDTVGPAIDDIMAATEALLFGRRLAGDGRPPPGRTGAATRSPIE
jgi:hypothetical protein